MVARMSSVALLLAALLSGCGDDFEARGGGLELAPNAIRLFGDANVATNPAKIDWDRVVKETPEQRSIRAEGIRPGSARHDLLLSKMMRRIRLACRGVAEDRGYDCVIRSMDLVSSGAAVGEDCTKVVIERLDRVDPR